MFAIRVTAALAAAAAVAALTIVPAAVAKDGDVRAAGACTKSSPSKLKLSNEDGRIELEFEVDQNRNGIPWAVSVSRNGELVASLTAVTKAPSGSFSVRRVVSAAPGANTVVAVATSPAGERCTARASL